MMNTNEQIIDEQTYLDILSRLNSLTDKANNARDNLKNFETLKNLDTVYGKDLTSIESLCNNLSEKARRLQVIIDNYCKEAKGLEESNINSIDSIEIPKEFETRGVISMFTPIVPSLKDINITKLNIALPTITVSLPKYIEPTTQPPQEVPETSPLEEEQPIATNESPLNGETSLGGQFVIENKNFFNDSSFEDSIGATSKVNKKEENAVTFDKNGIDFFTSVVGLGNGIASNDTSNTNNTNSTSNTFNTSSINNTNNTINSFNAINTANNAFSSVINNLENNSKKGSFASGVNQNIADILKKNN